MTPAAVELYERQSTLWPELAWRTTGEMRHTGLACEVFRIVLPATFSCFIQHGVNTPFLKRRLKKALAQPDYETKVMTGRKTFLVAFK